ncbi:MAG: hypothetical protein U9Q85_00740 [Patescibacteria group bacterium]|nr:hypothetical protein [Patescibacteria group bacterium]
MEDVKVGLLYPFTSKDYKSLEKYFKISPDLLVLPKRLQEHESSRIIDIRDINNIKELRK